MQVSKDAKECMQECVSEFISFLTSEYAILALSCHFDSLGFIAFLVPPCRASDRCIDEKRKTITGDDILFALSTLGFDNYVEPLQIYLKKDREVSSIDCFRSLTVVAPPLSAVT